MNRPYKLFDNIMLKILALETSTDACSAAVLYDDKIIERYEVAPRQHAQLILPMVKEILAEAHLELTDISAIAFGCGPGSFTGLRIACSAAQGLAFGTDLPIVAVSSLQALAQGAYEEKGLNKVLVGIDAKMQEIYFGIYEKNNENLMQPIQPDNLISSENCRGIPCGCPSLESGHPWIGIGDAWQEYPQKFKTIAYNYPKARYVAKLAKNDFIAGKIISPENAQPVYLRSEKAWKKIPHFPLKKGN
jgi:tRNA threonylcarbamoyladenosine biosynthesis protein TsaB